MSKESLLVVSAHVGDFVWRAGGAIALYASRGHEVHVVCLAYGERGESARYWRMGMGLDEVKAARHEEAAETLREAVRSYPADPRLRSLQSQSYAALGKRLLQHQAQAEYYALQGSVPAAIEQLQLARRAGDGDFYQLSVVDARLKELRAQHSQELRDKR